MKDTRFVEAFELVPAYVARDTGRVIPAHLGPSLHVGARFDNDFRGAVVDALRVAYEGRRAPLGGPNPWWRDEDGYVQLVVVEMIIRDGYVASVRYMHTKVHEQGTPTHWRWGEWLAPFGPGLPCPWHLYDNPLYADRELEGADVR